MTPQTLEADPAKVNGKTSQGPNSGVPLDPIEAILGDGTDAPISPEEAAVLRGETPAPEENQPTAESTEEAGEEVDGEEGAESTGETPEGEEASLEAENEAIFKDALRMANGDPKKALEIARVALGVKGDGEEEAAPVGPESIAKAVETECEQAVAKFYEDRGTEEKPGDERKALSKLLAAREVALVQKVGALLDQFEGQMTAKTKVKASEAELWKTHPNWVKDKAAFLRFVQESPARRALSHVDAYDLFLAKKARGTAPAAAKKDAATQAAIDRKAKGVSAQASAGGRVAGPTGGAKTLTTEQREIRFLRGNPSRIPRLP